MQELRRIPSGTFAFDPNQPRKTADRAELLALGENMKAIGQQVPVICYPVADTQMLCDGARRVMAARLVGLNDLLALVLPERPDAVVLRVAQMSIEAHKVGLSLWERSCFLSAMRKECGWSVSELASRLSMKQPLVTKLLSHQRLAKPLQERLHAGKLDMEKAFIISQESDPERQCEIARLYIHLPRGELRQKLKTSAHPEATSKRATFCLADGFSVTMRGPDVSLGGAIECLQEALKELKAAQKKNLDINSAQKAMRKKAHAELAIGNERAG
jgi:ParB/RepB/Spo0J family partition protein